MTEVSDSSCDLFAPPPYRTPKPEREGGKLHDVLSSESQFFNNDKLQRTWTEESLTLQLIPLLLVPRRLPLSPNLPGPQFAR
jgi:hypothetical protein